ncbi:MAG: hypothetical protein KDJ99_09020 [Candidatus Competibacteraceae bacterium]|nr:hypothetical protein [Candidatus Competibacteraceae bacterium]
MNSKFIQLVIVVSMLILTAGCVLSMMDDFFKGTEITTLDIGRAQTDVKIIELPYGDADLTFVPQDHDCNKALNVIVEITIQSAKRLIKWHEVNLGELTWPKTSDGCQPFGYLRDNSENMARPLKFAIVNEDNPIKFTFKVKQGSVPGRQVSVWVVYNSRVPAKRMLGKIP